MGHIQLDFYIQLEVGVGPSTSARPGGGGPPIPGWGLGGDPRSLMGSWLFTSNAPRNSIIIRAVDLKSQQLLDLKIQQALCLELVGMPR